MQSHLAALAIISGFFISRLAERRYHTRNLGYLTVSGAEELIPHVMRHYYGMLNITPIVAYGEWLFWWPGALSRTWQLAAVLLIGLGFALKTWAIQSLGSIWTMRCVFVPGVAKVVKGPYRFLPHPEYLGRFLEGLGICFFFRARVTLCVFLYFTARYMISIVRTERRQLYELAEPKGALVQ